MVYSSRTTCRLPRPPDLLRRAGRQASRRWRRRVFFGWPERQRPGYRRNREGSRHCGRPCRVSIPLHSSPRFSSRQLSFLDFCPPQVQAYNRMRRRKRFLCPFKAWKNRCALDLSSPVTSLQSKATKTFIFTLLQIMEEPIYARSLPIATVQTPFLT